MRQALLLLVLGGCGFTPVDMLTGWDIDSDDDGMCDADECEAGSDPNDPDSDDDGSLDGDEFLAGTDPTDPDDHPYTGGWQVDRDCRDSIESTGNAVGDITSNFELPDQYGDTVRLHDFCGKAVLIVAAAFW